MNKDKHTLIPKWLLLALLLVAIYATSHQLQINKGEKALLNNGLQVHSLEQALQLAKRDNKWVLVNSSAIWCGVCQRLDREIFIQASINDFITQHFVYARVEYETAEGRAFSQQFRVLGFPNLLLLNPQGEAVSRLPITFEPQRFLTTLKTALAEAELQQAVY